MHPGVGGREEKVGRGVRRIRTGEAALPVKLSILFLTGALKGGVHWDYDSQNPQAKEGYVVGKVPLIRSLAITVELRVAWLLP